MAHAFSTDSTGLRSVPEPVVVEPRRRTGSTVGRLGLLLVVALFLLVFSPTALKLVNYWATNDTYNYAFLIPFISALLIWLRRSEVLQVPSSGGTVLGAILSVAGLVMLVAGRLSGTNLVEELSLVVTIWGLVLLLFGQRIAWALAFPLVFLLAMIPVWDLLTTRLHPYFQNYSASIGVAGLQLLGVPVHREGVFIQLPNITLEVAEACSGINYLISVLCLGIPLAALFVNRWPKRLLIVTAATLIALLSNGFRVATVALFAYSGMRGANGDIHGPFALFRSLLVSGVGFVALFALISRFADDGNRYDSLFRSSEIPRSRVPHPHVTVTGIVTAVILLSMTAVYERRHTIVEVPLKADLRTFPARIASWEALPLGSFTDDLRTMDFDDRLSRNYRAADGTELNLFVGYFRKQEQGRELAGQTIRTVLSSRPHSSYNLKLDNEQVPVNDFLKVVGRDTFHVTYWYTLNGGAVAHDYTEKLYSGWNAMVYGRSQGGITVVKAAIPADRTIEASRARVRDFLDGYVAAATNYIPQR